MWYICNIKPLICQYGQDFITLSCTISFYTTMFTKNETIINIWTLTIYVLCSLLWHESSTMYYKKYWWCLCTPLHFC